MRFSGLKLYYSNDCMCSVFRLNAILLHFIRFQHSMTSVKFSQRLRATVKSIRRFKKTADVIGSIIAVILTQNVVHRTNSRIQNNGGHFQYYYYRYSALGPVWAETRAQSGDWYSSGTLHPGQVIRGRLPFLYI
jgi:hypothetical protein